MKDEINTMHISPTIKFSTCFEALRVADSLNIFIKRRVEKYEKEGKNYKLDMYIGVSENRPDTGKFVEEKNGVGRPSRKFEPYLGKEDEAYVAPHLHILLVGNHNEVFFRDIIKYLKKYCYKKYHVNSYKTIKKYIEKQSRYFRRYSNLDKDPESLLDKRPCMGLPQVLVEEREESNPAKENNIMENNYNSINNANTQANIKVTSLIELIKSFLSLVNECEDDIDGFYNYLDEKLSDAYEKMNMIKEIGERLEKILAASLAQSNAVPHGNGYQPSSPPNNHYGPQCNQPPQYNCAPNGYADQHNAYNDQYAQNNMNGYNQQCNQPQQNNWEPNGYANQGNGNQNNMNGYSQQCNQPPQFNCTQNEFFYQQNVCIDNQYVPDYGCPSAPNGGCYTNQLAPF